MREKWAPFIESLRVTGPEVFAKYERTITKFCCGDFKRRRHAVRLSFNLADLRESGRFDPEMSLTQVRYADKQRKTPGRLTRAGGGTAVFIPRTTVAEKTAASFTTRTRTGSVISRTGRITRVQMVAWSGRAFTVWDIPTRTQRAIWRR
jgi:hypothetical protein